MRLTRHAVLLYLLLLPTLFVAQEYTVSTYRESSGLPNTVFKGICKDSLGYIWISSDAGLIRFDGVRFVQHRTGLPNLYTKYLYRTSNNRLLASTDGGVVEIHSSHDSAYFSVLVQAGTRAENNKVSYPKQLFEDRKGRLWISEETGLAMLEYGKLKYYHFTPKDIANSYYHSFSVLDDGWGTMLAFSQPGSFFRHDAKADRFVEQPEVRVNGTVESAVLLQPGLVLFGGTTGAYLLQLDQAGQVLSLRKVLDLNISHIERISATEALIGPWSNGLFRLQLTDGQAHVEQIDALLPDINHIFRDEEQNIWVAADNAVQLLRPAYFSSKVAGLSKFYTQTVDRMPDGTIFTSKGDLILRLDTTQDQLQFETLQSAKDQGHILHFAQTDSFDLCSTGDAKVVFFRGNTQHRVVPLQSYGRSVFQLFVDKQQYVWVAQDNSGGVVRISPNFEVKYFGARYGFTTHVYGAFEDSTGRLYLYSGGEKFLYRYEPDTETFTDLSDTTGLGLRRPVHITDFSSQAGRVLLASDQGLFEFRDEKLHRVPIGAFTQFEIRSVSLDPQNNIWAGTELGLIKVSGGDVSSFQAHNGLLNSNIPYRCIDVDRAGRIWVGTSEGLCVALTNEPGTPTIAPFLQRARFNGKPWLEGSKVEQGAYAEFDLRCLSYPSENIQYQARLEPLENDWRQPSNSNRLFYPKLPPGKYTLYLRAKQDGNHLWSKEIVYHFYVDRHWYLSPSAFLGYVLLAGLLVWLIVTLYTRRLHQQKKWLEGVVAERTSELLQKKQVLEQQKEELESQQTQLMLQNKQITLQNDKIQASIRYAQTIQGAILPLEHRWKKMFDYFVVFRPRDVVSGDFYWFTKEPQADGRELVFLSVIDCSGHGVPGAFMSMIAYSLLNEIVKVRKVYEPRDILTQLNRRIVEVLRQEDTDNNDGMDLAIARFDRIDDHSFQVLFGGAKNKLYHVHQGQTTVLVGDRKSVGGRHRPNDQRAFTQQSFVAHTGDLIYMPTDGMIDQNNAARQRFGSEHFRQLIARICSLPMHEQMRLLEAELNSYQQDQAQRDDITVLGLRL